MSAGIDLRRNALLRAVSEVVIVVLGILIAFGMDAWWDARSAGRWERTQLELLHEEALANLRHLDGVIEVDEATAANVRTILDFATDGARGAAAVFPDSVLMGLVAWRTSEISTGTLDALLASGDLGKLRDPELRNRLAAWPALVLDAQEDEILGRDFVEFVLTPALLGQGFLAPAYAARPGRGVPETPVDLGTPVIASSKLRDLASARLTHILLARRSLLDLQVELREIAALIERELAGHQGRF